MENVVEGIQRRVTKLIKRSKILQLQGQYGPPHIDSAVLANQQIFTYISYVGTPGGI